nr:Chain A, Putative pectin lyase [Geobacillus virus E2]7CHU_B Chain B, Putative pectin lyase [Geobacillus virus E2]7CHU_C Chain C, Putative pectin lyase [Geobacillus virus E2]
ENKTRWLNPVATFADIATTYPNPQHGDTVMVTDDGENSGSVYRYENGQWNLTQKHNDLAIADVQNKIGILKTIAVNVKEFGTKGDGVTDDTVAIQNAINSIVSSLNNASGQGGIVYFPTGTYKVTSKITINKSNIRLVGAGMSATCIKSTITNGNPVFEFVPSDTAQRLCFVGIEKMCIDGQNNDCIGVSLKKISLGRFLDFGVRYCANHGLYIEEVWDTNIIGLYNTDNGDLARNKHGVYIYNGTSDNSNRLLFIACHFEANNGSHVYFDSTGNRRRNGNNQFIGCKFHGKDPSALPGNNPNTPHMYLDGDVTYVMNCYFYQCNNDFIKVKGDRNKIIGCDFYNCTGYFVNLTGTSMLNVIDGCSGQYFGSGLAPFNNPTNENFFCSDFIGENRKLGWNRSYILDQGGRLALFQNVYRSGANFIQPKGTNASFGIQIADNTVDGVAFVGANASGTDNSNVTLTTLLNVTLDGIKPKVPITFTPVTASSTLNNSLFVDSADNKLKFKDNTGTVKIVTLT